MLVLPFDVLQRLNGRNKRNRFHRFIYTNLTYFPLIFDDYSALKPKSGAFSRSRIDM